jgi:PST family polysaccharide transporter
MLAGKIVANVAGLVGTIIVINLLDRGPNGTLEYGEAMAAYIVVMTASQITTLGLGQFVVVKGGSRPDLVFHATLIHIVLGLAAMVGVYALREPLGALIGAPGIGRFVAGLTVAIMLDRITLIPERVLIRQFHLRTVALSRTVGDLVYVGSTIVLAAQGWGGLSIVFGNIARSLTRAVIMCSAVEAREWLALARIRWESIRVIWKFSGPLWIGSLAAFASRRWDNLLVSHFYGADVMGSYNVAYNLAENPQVVGEQAIDVLLPSLSTMPSRTRGAAFVRSLAMLAFLTAPLAVGIGIVAPTLVATFLGADRAEVAPMLLILASMSITRPSMWASTAYFQATDRTKLAMYLEVASLIAMLVALATIGRIHVLWACGAIGLVAALRALVTAYVIRAVDGTPLGRFFWAQLRPVFACIPMMIAVLVARHALESVHVGHGAQLAAEIACGAVAYVCAAWLFANETFRDALDLGRRLIQRRRDLATA